MAVKQIDKTSAVEVLDTLTEIMAEMDPGFNAKDYLRVKDSKHIEKKFYFPDKLMPILASFCRLFRENFNWDWQKDQKDPNTWTYLGDDEEEDRELTTSETNIINKVMGPSSKPKKEKQLTICRAVLGGSKCIDTAGPNSTAIDRGNCAFHSSKYDQYDKVKIHAEKIGLHDIVDLCIKRMREIFGHKTD